MSIRINNNSNQPAPFENFNPAERPTSDFRQTLAAVEGGKQRELEKFLANLDILGYKLVQSFSLKDLEEFRQSIKTFLRATLGRSCQVEEESLWDDHGRSKVMARVTKINQALEDLGRQFLSRHPKPLEILAQVNLIRGLLLDLFA